MQPRRTLSPQQLTLFIVGLIFGPIGCGLLLSYYTRRIPEPVLPALVRIESIWITPSGNIERQRLVPCVSIKNPTDEKWNNLSVGLNEQFYGGEPKGVGPGEVVSMPLEGFIARNGSVHFPVGNRDIHLVTVFAQIPSGARAVSEHRMPGNTIQRPTAHANVDRTVTSDREQSETKTEGWVSATPR
ncbi:MAG: hypothetical protein ABL921_13570 [Pirellula sp.]